MISKIFRISIVIGISLAIYCTPEQEMSYTVVDGGGILLRCSVLSAVDSTSIDSVRVTLTEFAGTRIANPHVAYVTYSDSTGYFAVMYGTGYRIIDRDTIDRYTGCIVSLAKAGFKDTACSYSVTGAEFPRKIYLFPQ